MTDQIECFEGALFADCFKQAKCHPLPKASKEVQHICNDLAYILLQTISVRVFEVEGEGAGL